MTISAFTAGRICDAYQNKEPIKSIARRLKLARGTVKRVLAAPRLYDGTIKRTRSLSCKVEERRQAVRKLSLVNRKADGEAIERRYPTAAALAKRLEKEYPGINKSTVCRDLAAMKIAPRSRPKVVNNSPEANAKRLSFALKHRSTRLRRIVFSDECWVNDNDNSHRKEYCDTEDPASVPTLRVYQKRPAVKIMIWGAIGLNYKSPLIILKRSVTSESYTEDVLEKVKDELLDIDGLLFMQDNARPHTAGATIGWFADNGIPLLKDWPAHSPHLNPIEHLWALIHREVSRRRPKTFRALEKVAREVWDGIDMETINSHVKGFKNAMEKCVQRGGAPW